MFGVQLYKKNNARVLLSRILSILNLDWLQHACSVRGVYEWSMLAVFFVVSLTVSWHKSSKRLGFCLLKMKFGISLIIHNQNTKKNVANIDHYHGDEIRHI